MHFGRASQVARDQSAFADAPAKTAIEPVRSDANVELLTSVDDLAALDREWHALHRESPGATAFQSFAWLASWYEVWGRERTHVLAIRNSSGELVGLLPGARLNGRIELGGCGVSDYLGVLVDPRAAESTCAILTDATALWNCAFYDVPGDAPWPSAQSSGWTAAPASTCPVVPLPTTVEAFREALGTGLRRNLRRYGERLFSERDAELSTVTNRHELLPVLDVLFTIHGMRWEGRGSTGIFADHDVRTFHRRAAPRLFDDGLLRLHVLRVDGHIVGAQYVLVHRGRALSYIGGFDPAFNRYSPGSLLMAYSIEQAIGEQCSTFDLLRGVEAYKYTWGAVDRVSLSYTHHGTFA